MYDAGILQSRDFNIPIIGIGNLSTGGTGKTPLVEYVLKLLYQNDIKVAVLSRGYKRTTKGFIKVSDQSAQEVGDEPYMISKKYPFASVFVCENRVHGINQILEENVAEVIILDDSFQHRQVKPGLNILLTAYSRPFTDDWLLPSGNLRDLKSSKRRADVIVITKSPKILSPFEIDRLKSLIKPQKSQDFYFSYIAYHKLRSYKNPVQPVPLSDFKNNKVVLFTGIANSQSIEQYLKRKCKEVKLLKFPDHHEYKPKDLKKIENLINFHLLGDTIAITTEKDIRRIETSELANQFKELPLFYLPIEFLFHAPENDGIDFDDKILNYVRPNKRDL